MGTKIDIEEIIKYVSNGVTQEIEEYVNKEVFLGKEYVFIDKKDNTAYCTYCNTRIKDKSVIKIRHNDYGKCPICKSEVTFKSVRMGRKNISNTACIYYFEKYKEMILCKGLFVRKDYENYEEADINYDLCAIYIFTREEQIMLKKSYYCEGFKKTATIYPFDINSLAKHESYIAKKSVYKAIKYTDFKYMPINFFTEGSFDNKYGMSRAILNLFGIYIKYPWVEQMCKIGFSKIVEYMLYKKGLMNCINKKGKNVFEILEMNRAEVKEFINSKVDVTPINLTLFKIKKKDKSKMEIETIEKIMNKVYLGHEKKLIDICKKHKIDKVLGYLEKQSKIQSLPIARIELMWEDYIRDCEELDYDIQDLYNLMPENLLTAHQKTIEKVKYKKSKELDEKIKKSLSKREKKFTYEYKNLLIRPARSAKEIIDEGAVLHHCVGGYTKRYAEGQTNILFIRRKDKKEEPFYTVEVRDNFVIQVYGYKNCEATEEVKEFIEELKKQKLIKNGVNKNERK